MKGKIYLPILCTWILSIVSGPIVFGQDSTTYYLTEIEVRTVTEMVDELSQCRGMYMHLHDLSNQQAKALRYSNTVIDSLAKVITAKDSISSDLMELQQKGYLDLKKRIATEHRKRKWNAALMYAATGIAIAEMIILIAN